MYKIETKFEAADSWLMENAKRAPFSQSFEWEEILSREGKEVERLTIVGDKEPVAMALVEYLYLPFGLKYAFCPKGPVFGRNEKTENRKQEVFSAMREYFKKKRCIFFRIEPDEIPTDATKARDVNPRATMILDMRKTTDDILKGMHQKTRYNINLSQKKDLRVTDKKDADLFMRMMRETAKRDKFRLHQDRHYHEMIFSPLSYQLTVWAGERPVATAVFAGFGGTFTYVFGASDYESRAMMAPYLIQWEGIKMAQRFGYKYYDFFGVAPKLKTNRDEQLPNEYEYDPRHQYAGVTRFKQGFGGEYHEDPGAFDLIVSPWKYKLYQMFRAARRLI